MNWKLSLSSCFTFLFFFIQSCQIPFEKKEVSSSVQLENCPSIPTHALIQNLMVNFGKDHSLLNMKKNMVEQDLAKKNYISSYSVSYEPILGKLQFNFICPKPLMTTILLDKNGKENNRFVITEDGESYDYAYEDVLLNENRRFLSFPELRIDEKKFNPEIKEQLVRLIQGAPAGIKETLSEIYFNENNDLTLIMSVDNLPITVLLGQKEWELKFQKLKKVTGFLKSKNKIPSVINLSESKKVIVKF